MSKDTLHDLAEEWLNAIGTSADANATLHTCANELLDRLQGIEAEQHPDDAAIDQFAAAMKAKMAKSRAKGRGGWDDPSQCTDEHLADLLIHHLTKTNEGTLEDVATFAMMLHHRKADPGELSQAVSRWLASRAKNPFDIGLSNLEAVTGHSKEKSDKQCECRQCLRDRGETIGGLPAELCRMIVCSICQNKRCPHAEDHRYVCIRSNLPGQVPKISESK